MKQAKQTAKNATQKQAERLKELEKASNPREIKKRRKALKASIKPKTTQGTIRYEQMFENGICKVDAEMYSKTLKYEDINYQTAKASEQEEIFGIYSEFLNSFPSDISIQLSIVNRKVDEDEMADSVKIPNRDDAFDRYVTEMNNVVADKLKEGKNSIVREKYITLSCLTTDYTTAYRALARAEDQVKTVFSQQLKSKVRTLNGKERLELIHNINKPLEPFDFSWDDLVISGLSTKDIVAPMSFDFTPKNFYEFGENYGQVMVFQDYAPELTDRILSDLSDLDCNLIISLHMAPIEPAYAIATVEKKIALMEQEKVDALRKAYKDGHDIIPQNLKYMLTNTEDLLDDLRDHNQKLFKTTILVQTYAQGTDSKALDTLTNNINAIKAIGRKHSIAIDFLSYQQDDALNSIYPLGVNRIDYERNFTTAVLGALIPFTTKELFDPQGHYYGLNSISRNLVMCDRRKLPASNGFILGKTGSGKSVVAKKEIIQTLLASGDEVIIIDPEREYLPLCKAFGGEYVQISPATDNYINPFDISQNYGGEESTTPVQFKADFILTVCEMIMRSEVTPKQKSVIDRVVNMCYAKYFNNPRPENVPTLGTFMEQLKLQPEAEAKTVALSLELYVSGSLNLFNHRTNIDSSKRFTVYDICDLGKQLQDLGMMIVFDQVWNRISQNRQKGTRTWIYVDEMQLALSNPRSSQFFFELWTRARKWGAIPTGLTQNVATLLGNDKAEKMLSNSPFLCLLAQSETDALRLQEIAHASPEQMAYLRSGEIGSGLIHLDEGDINVPFKDEFPKNTSLYQLMTTKLDEVIANENKAKQSINASINVPQEPQAPVVNPIEAPVEAETFTFPETEKVPTTSVWTEPVEEPITKDLSELEEFLFPEVTTETATPSVEKQEETFTFPEMAKEPVQATPEQKPVTQAVDSTDYDSLVKQWEDEKRKLFAEQQAKATAPIEAPVEAETTAPMAERIEIPEDSPIAKFRAKFEGESSPKSEEPVKVDNEPVSVNTPLYSKLQDEETTAAQKTSEGFVGFRV